MPRKINQLGIDIGKNRFYPVGFDRKGAIALRQRLSRSQVLTWLTKHATLPHRHGGVRRSTSSRRLKAMATTNPARMYGELEPIENNQDP